MIRSACRLSRLCLGLISLAVVVVLALPSVCLAFTDVDSGSTEFSAVSYLVNADVLSGYPDDTFRPDQSVTRAQAVKLVVKQQGLEVSAATTRFSDVDSLYAPYVEAAASAGWVSGFKANMFGPYQSLQRQHLAVWLVRSFGWDSDAKALTPANVQTLLSKFSDAGMVTLESRNYVAYCVKRGFIAGDGAGHLTPDTPVTRAQTALMLYRAELSTLTVAQGIRFADHPDKTRVVVDVSATLRDVASEVHGNKLLVEVSEGAVKQPLSSTVDSQEVGVVQVAQESYRPQVMTVALDLRTFSRYQVFTLAPSDGLGNRLVIDIYRQEGQDGPPLVAIDPGHGGSESGAIGLDGLLEKVVNLKIAQRVNELLLDAGLRTVMTRSDDSYVDLTRRGEIANQAGATILVMIHNNANDGESHGTETFYWGTDSTNYSVEGKLLAETIQRSLVAAIGLSDRGAKTWYGKTLKVLDVANMPGVMVEVAFLDNPTENKLLEDPAFLEKAARGIARGALSYLDWDPELVPKP